MDISQMKNIVVLKNLPSNIVEEAIVVLKPNKKAIHVDCKDKKPLTDSRDVNNEKKDYIVKEAEMIIANYISNIENRKDKSSNGVKQITEKYNRLRLITFFLVGIILINIVFKIVI